MSKIKGKTLESVAEKINLVKEIIELKKSLPKDSAHIGAKASEMIELLMDGVLKDLGAEPEEQPAKTEKEKGTGSAEHPSANGHAQVEEAAKA